MLISPGRYRHYRGNEYEVLMTALSSNNGPSELTPMVVYRQIAASDRFPAGTVWVRTVEEFSSMVSVGDQVVPRYTRIS